jgi:hypothetical protein
MPSYCATVESGYALVDNLTEYGVALHPQTYGALSFPSLVGVSIAYDQKLLTWLTSEPAHGESHGCSTYVRLISWYIFFPD